MPVVAEIHEVELAAIVFFQGVFLRTLSQEFQLAGLSCTNDPDMVGSIFSNTLLLPIDGIFQLFKFK